MVYGVYSYSYTYIKNIHGIGIGFLYSNIHILCHRHSPSLPPNHHRFIIIGYDQVPQLTSSRMINVEGPFKMVNETDSYTAVRRAVLIGINYVGQQGQLSGCHNDVLNIKKVCSH